MKMTFQPKNKQRSKDKKLAKITTVIAIVFAIVVIVFWLLMTYQSKHPKTSTDTTPETTAEEVTGTIHAHPTVSEAVREAFLASENRALHIPNKRRRS